MFTLEFTPSALEDLKFLRKFERTLILSAIDRQLLSEAVTETKNRKLLQPNPLAQWELRIGKYRVFYDVSEANEIVKIKAIGYKEHNRLFIRGREFTL